MLAVIKWYLATLKSQYTSRASTLGSEKKPLNPFLGELFVGKWVDESDDGHIGETDLAIEQVSHHPPITAYGIENKKNNIVLQGYNRIRASMSATGSLNVRQFGHSILEFKDLNEQYLITLPHLHLEGLLVAAPFVELEQKAYIQSSAGYYATIEFTGRGYFYGKKNSFKAKVYKSYEDSVKKGKALYTIAGQWSGASNIAKGSSSPSSSDPLFIDIAKQKAQTLQVKPIEKQHELESRRAWAKVAEAIKTGDMNLIHAEKSKIENAQRDLRLKEKEAGTTWKNRWYEQVDYSKLPDDYDAFVKLAKMANLSIKNVPSSTLKGDSKEDGVDDETHWRFNRAKFDNETEVVI
ncbi:unnamed protein product [Ambrosiozyma monospora]|uniref:Unnamed protein product n=1 Tax=Ambrosiozyma monospora TaxID=43982 RepID=A0ACB5TZ73_AMBMO|nr:unnamed protein product [Ambrosiozyma monospora]